MGRDRKGHKKKKQRDMETSEREIRKKHKIMRHEWYEETQ